MMKHTGKGDVVLQNFSTQPKDQMITYLAETPEMTYSARNKHTERLTPGDTPTPTNPYKT
jgi:hypothetical protein